MTGAAAAHTARNERLTDTKPPRGKPQNAQQLRRIWWAITPYLMSNYAVFGERLGINGNTYHGIARFKQVFAACKFQNEVQ